MPDASPAPKLCEEWQAMEMPNITLEWHKVYPDECFS